jgi:hypothetical protein
MSESTWAPSPSGDTLAIIQKQVAGYVLMPTDPEVIDCAGQGIKRAIDRLNMRNWSWALTCDDITFVEAQYDYQLNSWFKAARHFELWNQSSESVGRLGYKPWKTFVLEHSVQASQCGPEVYSCRNASDNGLATLNAAPSLVWIASYPMGRILYYRRVQYPGSVGSPLGVPSEVVAYIQAQAEGYTADRFAVQKSRDAYTRAEILLRDLIRDDCHGQQTDWE